MLSEPNISYKPFWGICRPLKSWRANSPNPIQIYCAEIVEELENMELYASRRTISKYRKELNIPNSKQRKKQAIHMG